ncbi:MAG: tRNA dihydrouridine synthase DusB [Gammaproteobacteria bacterium HGW-Gammaproteobacteria-14]|nr:MAG: tRNA dihydrouridine synthase DusB [Gammaproteobacteria bacterium HGW-Gammaproteobacteria-14]
MRIGPHELSNNLVLAPMAGVTDLPFRQLCRRQGAGLIVSEMLISDPRLWHSRKSMRRLPHADEPGPVSIQIAGGDAAMLAEAARLNVEMGAEIIDINMGCPAKKVCRKQAGSALLANEELVGDILHAVVSAVNVPVTLKFRTGSSPEQRNAVRIARIAEAAGIQALALHGRTRACRFLGNAEYDTIADVVKSVSIPVLANGDIDTPEKARKVLAYTNAGGIMIGRAAQGNPWIFRDTAEWLATGTLPLPPSVREVRELVMEHLLALHAFYGVESGVRIARKHLGWYSTNLPQGEIFRQQFNQLDNAGAQERAVAQFFHNLESVTDRVRFGRYGDVSLADGRGDEQNGAKAA